MQKVVGASPIIHSLSEEPLVAAGKIRCARGNEFISSNAPWDLDHLPAGGLGQPA